MLQRVVAIDTIHLKQGRLISRMSLFPDMGSRLQCSTRTCLCKKGRSFSQDWTIFEILPCHLCGSVAVHLECQKIPIQVNPGTAQQWELRENAGITTQPLSWLIITRSAFTRSPFGFPFCSREIVGNLLLPVYVVS
jgi:hypothetical protein